MKKLVRNPVHGTRVEQLDLDPGQQVAVTERVARDAVNRWQFLSLGDVVEETPEEVVETPVEAAEEPVTEVEPEEEELDLESLKKDELKALAKERGLQVSGTKKQLIKRLS